MIAHIYIYILFAIQIVLFIIYRLNFVLIALHDIDNKNKLDVINNFISIIPTDYCQITQLLSILIVVIRNNKFFSVCAIYPMLASWMAIIYPSDGPQRGSYDYWYYYEYFISHVVSILIPFMMFKYGLRKFDTEMFKWNMIWGLIGILIILPINWSLGRNDMELNPITRTPIDFIKILNTNSKEVNTAVGGLLNMFFVIFIMGALANCFSWYIYRYSKPYIDYETKAIINRSFSTKFYYIIKKWWNNKYNNFINQ